MISYIIIDVMKRQSQDSVCRPQLLKREESWSRHTATPIMHKIGIEKKKKWGGGGDKKKLW